MHWQNEAQLFPGKFAAVAILTRLQVRSSDTHFPAKLLRLQQRDLPPPLSTPLATHTFSLHFTPPRATLGQAQSLATPLHLVPSIIFVPPPSLILPLPQGRLNTSLSIFGSCSTFTFTRSFFFLLFYVSLVSTLPLL